MLVPGFYQILKLESSDQKIEALVSLNKDHIIYQGHFPFQPVVPGVMQLLMIKELVEKSMSCELLMSNITAAKFLNMIIPSTSKKIKIEIYLTELEKNQFKINAKLNEDELVFTKLKANLSVKENPGTKNTEVPN